MALLQIELPNTLHTLLPTSNYVRHYVAHVITHFALQIVLRTTDTAYDMLEAVSITCMLSNPCTCYVGVDGFVCANRCVCACVNCKCNIYTVYAI